MKCELEFAVVTNFTMIPVRAGTEPDSCLVDGFSSYQARMYIYILPLGCHGRHGCTWKAFLGSNL